ncbi:Rieske (2Fe-2S) protein [Azohydromonas australica]|uniref:Rieske (2Fe-2S) protein n=1 Tax=Azohydromonas australica TaxID=364039 RepID=UPI0004235F2B|nr:Rieske (2Fe-2S) protein [Azohydromonas australica]
MQKQSSWQPVAPSHHLRAADNIVAGFVDGEELALWRAADGTAQAWENRCPHRGTRLTLGRILDGRLSCAYHGWEFTANGGRCTSIPAHPSTPAPKNLNVTTYPVLEAAGMVWVRKRAADGGEAAAPAFEEAGHFCRTLSVCATEARVTEQLMELRFKQVAPRTWTGELASQHCTVFLNAASDALTFAHVWLTHRPQAPQLLAVMATLARLRERAEQPQLAGNAS